MTERSPTPPPFVVDDTVHISVSRPEGLGEAIPFVDLDDVPAPRPSRR